MLVNKGEEETGGKEGREVLEVEGGGSLSYSGGAKPVPNDLQLTKEEHFTQNSPVLVYSEQLFSCTCLSFLHRSQTLFSHRPLKY